jgi:hypothetical protein
MTVFILPSMMIQRDSRINTSSTTTRWLYTYYHYALIPNYLVNLLLLMSQASDLNTPLLALFANSPGHGNCKNIIVKTWHLQIIYHVEDYDRRRCGAAHTLTVFTRRWDVFSPNTKLMASIRFDLPLPFGPMTAVKGANGPMTCLPL